MIFDSFWARYQTGLMEQFLNLSQNHSSFIIQSKSRKICSQSAFSLSSEIMGKDIRRSPPPDLHVIRQEKVNNISIDDIRGMKDFISFKSMSGNRRIVIIDGADALSLEAQNALLKTLEEPPEDLVIMLCARNLDILLPTIRSRAIQICPVIPERAECIKFLSEFFCLDSARFLYSISAAEPGDMFDLPDEASKTLEEILSNSSEHLQNPCFPENDVFLEWVQNVTDGCGSVSGIIMNSYIYFSSLKTIAVLSSEGLDRALQSIGQSVTELTQATNAAKKNGLKKEQLDRITRDRIYPMYLLSLAQAIKPGENMFSDEIHSDRFNQKGIVNVLSRINDWFVSKNLKFLPYFENLLIQLSPQLNKNVQRESL